MEVEPSHLLAQENLGRLYERQGEWAKAAAVYQQGAEATASPVAYWQLGRLYERLGSLEEAAIAYQMAALGPPETDT
ncbi:MAG TPA: tetratricopeptide repeat protein [Armatimonadetes bacterium]|nr:tetratricopeptide repeat protein [Armatimonadota bacterium]